MAASATVLVRATVADDDGVEADRIERRTPIADVVGVSGKRETITLANGDNTLTVPTGARALILLPADDSRTIKLKGNAGDTGVTLFTTGGTRTDDDVVPAVIPIGSTPSSVILNSSGALTLDALWV